MTRSGIWDETDIGLISITYKNIERADHLHMNDTALLSSLQERWCEIESFPGYSVSDHGNIRNDKTDRFMSPSVNSRGLPIVGLMLNRRQHKRSVTLLVAQAFVPPSRPAFDTPINLDGDRFNNHYRNLMWRPLWFARKYMQQITPDSAAMYPHPIQDVETGEVYQDTRHAAVANGVLEEEIRVSMMTGTYVWPTGQIFRDPI